MSKSPVKIIKADQQNTPQTSQKSADLWQLPSVETEPTTEQATHTNALGKKSAWHFEPPEEEVEVVPLTAEDIEAIRQAAHEEGFNQGKEEGFSQGYDEGLVKGVSEGTEQGIAAGTEQGLAQGKENIETLASQWQGLIEQLQQPLASVEKNVEEQLLHLVVQLTEAVVLQEARTNPDILMAAISTGIKALPSNEPQTQIHLHPDDMTIVEQQFGEKHIKESGWHLLPAPQLTQGSCQIENSTSNIDLQIKSRLKQVLESFLQDALHQ